MMHFHRWSNWEDIGALKIFDESRHHDGDLPLEVWQRQLRTCTVCGLKRIRRIKERRS